MDTSVERHKMVERQIRRRGVRDERVLAAMTKVPRHEFVPETEQLYAYADRPLGIGYGQTISQPYMVAMMTEALEPSAHKRVLEIGTGSGYQAAILAELVAEVYTVERVPELLETARARLEALGCENCHFRHADGSIGWPDEAPFDGIIVTAAAPAVPQSLVSQLADGGVLLVPTGARWMQELIKITKVGDSVRERHLLDCVFVPLLGEEGWKP
jgi:protein-L-isoaspartate(D-aspartate) O-methyltransferase